MQLLLFFELLIDIVNDNRYHLQ